MKFFDWFRNKGSRYFLSDYEKTLLDRYEISEQRTRTILDCAYNAFVGMNSDGLITDWNPQAERTFGWKRDEVLGRELSEIIIPHKYREAHKKGLANYLATGHGPVLNKRMEITALHHEGHEIPVEMTIFPFDHKGKHLFGSFLHDISERKNSESKVRNLYQDLEQRVQERTQELALANKQLKEDANIRQRLYEQAQTANRLKDEFLATVSHELRTPLNVILGHSDILKDPETSKEEAQASINAIHRNAQIQVQIISDLLDVSRIISGKLQLHVKPIEIESVVEAAYESVQIAAKSKNINVRVEGPERVKAVGGDPERLQQVLWNLLSNAIKFTPKGGNITVKLSNVESRVQIDVIDNGKGIDPHFLPYVFERFRQEDASTTRRYGGLGLGLAIVRHIVEGHGGTVAATSGGTNQGSRFTVCLPVLAAHMQDGIRERHFGYENFVETQPQHPKHLDEVRIMIVDDDVDTRNLLSLVLKKSGANVVTADSAQKAFDLFQVFNPQVLLSDISMPDIDGYTLLKMIRTLPNTENLWAIALTAHARSEEHERALAAGFHIHISKPVQSAELINTISDLLMSEENKKKSADRPL
ncbi:ATP-binding protein [Bdellovibrio sp. HCB290]|uniref:hybrid sensor histidine kinase/response regulator n=1 Tax=Bdellovibrio sp. HCB290 TaxID=3394356 RepID=UPI0039B59B72